MDSTLFGGPQEKRVEFLKNHSSGADAAPVRVHLGDRTMKYHLLRRAVAPVSFVVCLGLAASADGQSAGQFVVTPAPTRTMGTFYPDRYLYYGGDVNPRAGYFPLGMYGPNTLALDGPSSNYRAVAAPLTTYVRGYNGVYWPTVGTTFSYPNLPELAPTVYPTRANFFYGPRTLRTMPQWQRATQWIDQN